MPYFKVFVINGSGGSGKDTFCSFFKELFQYDASHMNFKDGGFHTFDCIYTSTLSKRFAEEMGWKGTKTLADRKYLSDLKDMLDYWNDATRKYLKEWIFDNYYNIFKSRYSTPVPDSFVVFVHAREAKDIDYVNALCVSEGIYCKTILIDKKDNIKKGNHADDSVNDYKYYNWYIHNYGDLTEFKSTVRKFYELVMYDVLKSNEELKR